MEIDFQMIDPFTKTRLLAQCSLALACSLAMCSLEAFAALCCYLRKVGMKAAVLGW